MAVVWKSLGTTYEKSLHSKTDFITTVHWECTETDGDIQAREYGAVGLGEPSGSYTPYADVTEAQALNWAKAALGSDKVTEIEAAVASQLIYLKNPPVKQGTPWS
tara:strand:- start:162 stop:476 length:315 start_codon:yes stop_codon:yes gene_type:complete